MNLSFLLVALFSVTIAPSAEPSCGSRIESSPQRRTMALPGDGGNRLHLVIVPPNAVAITCKGGDAFELRVPARQLPRGTNVVFRVSGPDGEWEMTLSRRQLEKPLHISAPRGTYELSVTARHFRTWRKRVVAGAQPQQVVVPLERLPTLTGIVIDDETAQPVGGALVRTDAEAEAVTDGTGRFSIEADPEHWPKRLTAHAGGYAEGEVRVPTAQANANLDEIRLSRGGSVLVELRQPHPGDVVALELQRLHENGRALGATVQTLSVRDETAFRFLKVEPGRYIVLAKGDQPWERVAEPVTVATGEQATVALHIEPFRLRVRVSAGGRPIGNADVLLQNRDVLWQGSFAADAKGEGAVGLWQGGRVWATVHAPAFLPYKEGRTLAGGIDDEWFLDIPAHEVVGVVVDAESGKPVPNAALALHMHGNEGYMLGVKAQAGADGAFRFAPVARGEHTLSAAAPGYPPVELKYTFTGSNPTHELTIRLDRAATVPLTVLDGFDRPVVAARVLDFIGTTRRGLGFTDADGSIGVQVSAGETRDVFVIPREGSLGFLQIRAASKKETLRISTGTCRLVVRMESEERVPIPGISIAVRYNGRMLPYEVLQALVTMHGARTKSDAQGRIVLDHMPSGLYEFWPVGSPAELRAVAASGGGEAPAKLLAVAGENVTVMTFAPAVPLASSLK